MVGHNLLKIYYPHSRYSTNNIQGRNIEWLTTNESLTWDNGLADDGGAQWLSEYMRLSVSESLCIREVGVHTVTSHVFQNVLLILVTWDITTTNKL